MKKWIKIAIPVAAVAVFVAWYAFRPERLVINRHIDEALPSAQGSSSPQPVVSGQFYSILHPTAGTATIYQMGDGTRVLRFTRFSTSNGPDVHVYMVADDDIQVQGRQILRPETRAVITKDAFGRTCPCSRR